MVRTYSHTVSMASTDPSIESVEDEDEVLTALSDELGGFVEYVGGPDFGHCLLSPLENLATIEEPLVRDKVSERPMDTTVATSLTITGRRVPQQDLRAAQPKASRRTLHSPHIPPLKGRLVYIKDFGHWPLQHTLSAREPSVPGATEATLLSAGPR